VRHELLPLLEDLSPQIVKHLNLLSDALARELPETSGPESLKRAQLEQLYRALRLGRSGARLAIDDGLEISIQRRKAVSARKMARIEPDFRETYESGGAKPGKRG
jgi:hypothetical protein